MARQSELDAWAREGERRARRWERAASIARGAVVVILVLGGIATWYFVDGNRIEVSDERARHAIESSGFRDVKLGGADAYACAEAERSRHFAATNPAGRRVEGTVCCGLTERHQGCTLRWGR